MTKTDNVVSILGSTYFQPVADLLEKWLRRDKPTASGWQSGFYENGYATSVILLLVSMFESYMVRVRYMNDNLVPKNTNKTLDVLFALYPTFPFKKAITEVYVIRDLITHNHLWDIDLKWTGHKVAIGDATKHSAFGDKKYFERVNLGKRRTKALNLSIVPTRINRIDTIKIFETIWKALTFLERKNHNQCPVSHNYIRFNRKAIPFEKLLKELKINRNHRLHTKTKTDLLR